MAKKAKSEEVEVVDDGEMAMKAIKKKYGDIVRRGCDIFDEKSNKTCVSVSPAYDLGLNGGILEGSWTVISGVEKCGKSSLTLQTIANGQTQGRRGIYADAESRLKAYNLAGIHGLNQSELEVISGKDEDLSAEDILNTINDMIRMPRNRGSVCVIDSTSSLLPRDEMDSEVSSKLRAQLPKLLSHWIKKNAQVVVRNDILMILITHYITNTSGYGKHKLADCGVMVQYQADNRLNFTHVEPWEENGKKIGQKTMCDINCSAMGSSGKTVTSYLRFGHGIDFTKEYIELGESFGLIEKAGAWFTMPYLAGCAELSDAATQKFQGQQKVYDFISSHPVAGEFLKKELTTLLL
jgi:recombination protein RecA